MRDENLQLRWSIQTKRIERIVASMLAPKFHRITYVFSEDEISFRIDGSNGDVLAEAYRGTPIREIEKMTEEQIEHKLKELFANKQLANLPA